MDYLFFDIECANCFNSMGKICEFGYILVDKDFNVIEENNILINPNSSFDWYVLKKMLAYKEKDYIKSPKYPYFYEKIRSLFNDNTLVFGHTVDADAKYLNDENARYNLPYFDYKFYDIMFLYKEFVGSKDRLGLTKIANEIGSKLPEHEHRALDDAICTMNVLKSICEKSGKTPLELTKKYISCCGMTNNGEITTVAREQARQLRIEKGKKSNKMSGEKFSLFLKFLDNVKPEGEVIQNELTGKNLCITLNYQNTHYKEMVSLVQLLANCGCTYTLRATKCDYFVTKEVLNKDGTAKKCTRLEYVKEGNKKGKDIKIITFNKLLKILNITEKTLSNMDFTNKSEDK